MMQRKRWEMVLEAEQPIAHHSGTIGNHAVLMTRRVRTVRGWEDVPCVTADTMRHKLREAASLVLLDAAGLGEESLTEAALRLLFNGGAIVPKKEMKKGAGDSTSVRFDAYRELAELVPSLALFGGCAQNRQVPGKLTVEDAILICEETERYVTPWQLATAKSVFPLDTYSAHVEQVQRVRMDAALNPAMRKLLTSEAQTKLLGQITESERASEAGDAVAKDDAKSNMLPRTFERVAAGSLFAWSVEAIVQSDLEEDVFHTTMCAFATRAQVGGKAGTGHGRLRVVAANEVQMATPSREYETLDTTALGLRVGQLLKAHVEPRKTRIAEFLRQVVA